MVFSLEYLSKYRNQLLGIAILWVMLFHARLLTLPFINAIKLTGYGGVDICIMLSGYGIFYSLKKNRGIKSFIKKRLLRILPSYLLIVILYSIIMYRLGEIDIYDIFLNTSMLFYIFSDSLTFNWYIPAIILIYISAPLGCWMFTSISQKKIFIYLVLLLSILLITVSNVIGIERYNSLITRLPLFYIGFYLAFLTDNKQVLISKEKKFILFILFIIGEVALQWLIFQDNSVLLGRMGLYWFPYIVIIPYVTLFLSATMEQIRNSNLKGLLKLVNRILSYLGTRLLQMYLVSVSLSDLGMVLIKSEFVIQHSLLYNIILLVVIFLCSELVFVFDIWVKRLIIRKNILVIGE